MCHLRGYTKIGVKNVIMRWFRKYPAVKMTLLCWVLTWSLLLETRYWIYHLKFNFCRNETQFQQKIWKKIDDNQLPFLFYHTTNIWMGIRLVSWHNFIFFFPDCSTIIHQVSADLCSSIVFVPSNSKKLSDFNLLVLAVYWMFNTAQVELSSYAYLISLKHWSLWV